MFPRRHIGRPSIGHLGHDAPSSQASSGPAPTLSLTPALDRKPSALETIADRMSKALHDFESLYDENAPDEDALLTGISDHINSMAGGEMKYKMKTFLNKYKDMSQQATEVGRQRDDILESLAEWFSSDHGMTVSYDDDEDASARTGSDGIVQARMGFDKLQSINKEIVHQASRGRDTQHLQSEKQDLQKKVVSAFKKANKEKKSLAEPDPKAVDQAWKYAASEICGLLNKVRLQGIDDIHRLEEQLKKILGTLEAQQDKAASLEKNLITQKKMLTKCQKENLDLTNDSADYKSKLRKLKKEYKNVCQSLAKFDPTAKRKLQMMADDDDLMGETPDGLDATVGLGRSESIDPMIMKSRLRDAQTTIQRLEHESQELKQEVKYLKSDENPTVQDLRADISKLLSTEKDDEAMIHRLKREKLDLVHELDVVKLEIETHARNKKEFDGSLTGVAIKPPSVCQVCGGGMQRSSSESKAKHSNDRLTKELEQNQRRIVAMEQQLSKAHREIIILKTSTPSSSAPCPTPLVSDDQQSTGHKAIEETQRTPVAPKKDDEAEEAITHQVDILDLHHTENTQAPTKTVVNIVSDPEQGSPLQSPQASRKKNLTSRGVSRGQDHKHVVEVPDVEEFQVVEMGTQTDPGLDPFQNLSKMKKDKGPLQSSLPPQDWVDFNIPVPVEGRDQEVMDVRNAMLRMSAPDDLNDLMDLTSSNLERVIQRMVHGVNGFTKHATELIQQEIVKMSAANAELKKLLTDDQRWQFDKKMWELSKPSPEDNMFPGLVGEHPPAGAALDGLPGARLGQPRSLARLRVPGLTPLGAADDMLNLTNEEILHNFAALTIKKLTLKEKVNPSLSIFRPETSEIVRGQLETLGDNCIHLLGGTQKFFNFMMGKEQKEYEYIYQMIGPEAPKTPLRQPEVKTSRSHLGFIDHERDQSAYLSPSMLVTRMTSHSDMDLSKKSSKSNTQIENEPPKNFDLSHAHPKLTEKPSSLQIGPKFEYKVPKAMIPKKGLIKLTALAKEQKNPAMYDEYLKEKDTSGFMKSFGLSSKHIGRKVKPLPLSHKKLVTKQREILEHQQAHEDRERDHQDWRSELSQTKQNLTIEDLQMGILNFETPAQSRRKVNADADTKNQVMTTDEAEDKSSQVLPLTPREIHLPPLRT